MKKIFYLSLIAFGAMVSFTACGDEAENSPKTEKNSKDSSAITDNLLPDIIQRDSTGYTLPVNAQMEEKGNQVILSASVNDSITGNYTTQVVATFDGNICTGATQTITFANELEASEAFQFMMEGFFEEGITVDNVTLQGNTIIINLNTIVAGKDKETVKQILVKMANDAEDEGDEEPKPSIPNATPVIVDSARVDSTIHAIIDQPEIIDSIIDSFINPGKIDSIM